jgi:hypothetical protein
MYKIFKILIISCLFFSFIADAGLIRTVGRGTVSNNSATIVLLVPETQISTNSNYLFYDYYTQFGHDAEVVMESGSERIYTVPDYCYTFVGDQSQLANYNEPCYWQFAQGEQLQMFGFLDHLFDDTIKETFWQITSATFEQSYFSPEVSTVARNDSTTQADIYLDTAMPANMIAGEYEVFANFKQMAPTGYVFYQYAWVDSQQICGQVSADPNDIECWLPGQVLGSTFDNNSVATRLVITAVNQVNSPPTIFLSLMTMFVLFRLRRQRQFN